MSFVLKEFCKLPRFLQVSKKQSTVLSGRILSSKTIDAVLSRCLVSVSICSQREKLLENETNEHFKIQKRFAGHSKWANIRHIKAAKDQKKGQMAAKIAMKIKIAVREGGSLDPKFNLQLSRVIEMGQYHDVPNATMQNVINHLKKSKDNGAMVTLEGKAVGNCMLIFETFTDKPKRTRQDIQHVIKQFGGTLGNTGLAQHMFDHKGLVHLPISPEKTFTADESMELAIEVGAEDVHEIIDENGMQVLEFISDPKEFSIVKTGLTDLGHEVTYAKLGYVPHTFVPLDKIQLENMSRMYDMLDEIQDIVKIFDNIQAKEE